MIPRVVAGSLDFRKLLLHRVAPSAQFLELLLVSILHTDKRLLRLNIQLRNLSIPSVKLLFELSDIGVSRGHGFLHMPARGKPLGSMHCRMRSGTLLNKRPFEVAVNKSS